MAMSVELTLGLTFNLPHCTYCFKFVLNFWSHRCLISCCVSSWCLFPIPLFEANHIKFHWQQWLSTWSSSKFFIGGENSLRCTSQDEKEGLLSLVLFWKNSLIEWIWTVDLIWSSLVNWTRHTQIWTYQSLHTLCLHCHLGSLQSTTLNPSHLLVLCLLGFAPHHSLSLPSLLICHLVQSFQLLRTTTFVIFVHAWMTYLGCMKKNFQNASKRSLIKL